MFFKRHLAYKLTIGPEVNTERPRDFYLLAMLINSLIDGINNCTQLESKSKSIQQLTEALQFLNKFHTAREGSFIAIQPPEIPRIQETAVASTRRPRATMQASSTSLIPMATAKHLTQALLMVFQAPGRIMQAH